MVKILLIIFFMFITLWGNKINIDDQRLKGNWHLRIIDGMEVRKARAILDFHPNEMRISGFDSCNRINGLLKTNSPLSAYIPMIEATRMACRTKMHLWVSQKIHETLHSEFSIQEDVQNGVTGITLKSKKHNLFLKKMGITQ